MMKNPSKTVCFVNSNKAWGGGEKWHFTTCKEFMRRGYQSLLMTNENSEIAKRGIKEGLNVYQFKIGNLSFLNPVKVFVFALFFKTKKVDAIVVNLPSDLKLAGIAAKIAGVKKIIYRRGMPHPLRNTFLNRFLFTKILTQVVVNSKEIGKSLRKGNEEWFPNEKVVLIYNGVDSSRPLEHKMKLYEKKESEVVIGNAGRLTEQKGQKYLIQLAKLLRAEGLQFKLLIAGEGELRGPLEKLVKEDNLTDYVKFLGHVQDMPSFFNSLDAFVFTSLYEGSANTLIETLQYGVPTVAWDISSNPEIIITGETGLLATFGDVQELKDRLKACLDDQKLRQKLIQNGQEKIKNTFDKDKNLQIFIDLIQE